MTDRELMQQALEALEKTDMYDECLLLREALRARLAQPEQEPVAWCIVENGRVHGLVKTKPAVMNAERWQPLYTAPPQREWKELTKEEARELCVANVPYVVDMVAALEARLKEKNT